MTGIKTALPALTLFLCIFVSGCGKDLFVPTTSGNGTGNWLITGYYVDGSSIVPYYIGGSLIDTGGQLTGVFHINTSCFGSAATDIPYTGTLDGDNHLSIISAAVNGQILIVQGTLSAEGSTLGNGAFGVTGGCSGSIVGFTGNDGPGSEIQTTGVRIPSLNGTWVTDPNFSPTLNLTEQLTQSPTSDIHGDYALTGTVTVQGSPCFTQGIIQPTSFVSGNLGHELILLNDGSILSTPMQVLVPISGKPSISLYPGTITGGNCSGPVDISLQ